MFVCPYKLIINLRGLSYVDIAIVHRPVPSRQPDYFYSVCV